MTSVGLLQPEVEDCFATGATACCGRSKGANTMGCSQAKAGAGNGAKGSAVGSPKSSQPVGKGISGDRPILGKYHMLTGKEDIMGKGTSSICRKGREIATGKLVAIKVYKEQSAGGKVKDTTMLKYKRQIQVLKELQEPFKPPADPTLWSDILAKVQPSQLFMTLLDYSKDANGEPAPDAEDGMLYVVTELAQYSLKDFLADRREKQKPLSKDAVRDLSKRCILAMAGLHAKGFVHVDMKPENMMVFDGRLKVIDVDGCVRTGSKVSINDGSISFSPCYCAPEWARFMIKDTEQNIEAAPSLDVWSVGMILCEFVTLDAIWKPQYANFMRNASSHREAGFLFLEWLGEIKKSPLPKPIEKFDPDFLKLLHEWLLVCNYKNRKSCAQVLSNPWLAEGGWDKYTDANSKTETQQPVRQHRERQEDESTLAPLYKGTLWKLNTGSNGQDVANWIKRDMWVAHNCSLCYFSVKENKRLVLVDGEKIYQSEIAPLKNVAKEFAFILQSKSDAEEKMEMQYLAAETKEEFDRWHEKLHSATQVNMNMTFHLGPRMEEELNAFKLAVRNRRIKVEEKTGDAFTPSFKAMLWKLKTGGDRTQADHWFHRDMWIAKNSSLVYYSPKDDRELVYYTAADMQKAVVKALDDGLACRKFAFMIVLSATDGVEFDPGEFAAESEEEKQRWMAELRKVTVG